MIQDVEKTQSFFIILGGQEFGGVVWFSMFSLGDLSPWCLTHLSLGIVGLNCFGNSLFRCQDGNTPLHVACASENSSGALIVVQTLLDADADLTSVNNARNSAFHIACLNGNHQILEFLSAQEIFSEIWELRNSYLQVKSVHLHSPRGHGAKDRGRLLTILFYSV